MASKDSSSPSSTDSVPFGAMAPPSTSTGGGSDGGNGRSSSEDGRRREGGGRRRRRRRGSRGHAGNAESNGEGSNTTETSTAVESEGGGSRKKRSQKRRNKGGRGQRSGGHGGQGQGGQGQGGQGGQGQGGSDRAKQGARAATGEVEGWLVVDKGNHGHLLVAENDFQSKKSDVHVAPRFIQKYQLRDGALVRGRYGRGQGKHKHDLVELETVDGMKPEEARKLPNFKQLVSIDPDFHYAVGDGSGEVSLRIVDLLCPVGRGQRGLIVAPPRSGKTVLLQKLAKAVEAQYPDVHLMVLLIDERPEEATEWKRTIEHGQVFVSTNDEMPKKHVELAEAVWRRCKRLVELGEDVILLLDSITRLARAYNHVHGTSGKTMSGGIDARTMERPKQFFGSARNTETAGSLTILGTTLVETGSRMDQVIFEEFKGTGNMELVLSRRLSDRRIFPALDVERSGTRKEEKLISSRKLKLVHTLRRVLNRMHWAEAMELLITKLEDVEKTDDFLKRFEIDPEE